MMRRVRVDMLPVGVAVQQVLTIVIVHDETTLLGELLRLHGAPMSVRYGLGLCAVHARREVGRIVVAMNRGQRSPHWRRDIGRISRMGGSSGCGVASERGCVCGQRGFVKASRDQRHARSLRRHADGELTRRQRLETELKRTSRARAELERVRSTKSGGGSADAQRALRETQ